MMLLDDSSPRAIVVDTTLPPSHAALHEALLTTWPRLRGRIEFVEGPIDAVEVLPADIAVSSHACGDLTDRVLACAVAARARVAVLPCCHDFATCDAGRLAGWVERSLAIDVLRATRLEQQGYHIWTQTIRSEITPKNRLLLGAPDEGDGTSAA
jgi:hypothetical protein